MQAIVDRIAPSHLHGLFWLFTILSLIVVPLVAATLAGFFGVTAIKINDRIAELNGPQHHLLTTAHAVVELNLGYIPTGAEHPHPLAPAAILWFEALKDVKRGTSSLSLVADDFKKWGNAQSTTYFLNFDLQPPFGAIGRRQTVAVFFDELRAFRMQISFLPMHTQILGGTITLVTNSIFKSSHPIPPQPLSQFIQISGPLDSGIPSIDNR